MFRDRQHDVSVKSVDRLIKDLERTNSQLNLLLDDLSNVEIIYESKQRELSRNQESCFTDESAVQVGVFRELDFIDNQCT